MRLLPPIVSHRSLIDLEILRLIDMCRSSEQLLCSRLLVAWFLIIQ
jgi:hypothetical protein